jgi:hypothetical protein
MASEAYGIAASDGAIESFARSMKDSMTGAAPEFFRPEEHLLKYNLDQRPAHLLANDCTEFFNRSNEYFDEVRQRILDLLSTWDAVCASRNFHYRMPGRSLDVNFIRNLLLCGVVVPDRSNFGYKPQPEVLRYNKRIQTQDTLMSMLPHGSLRGQYPTAPQVYMAPFNGGAEAPNLANAPTNTGWAPLFQSPDVASGQDGLGGVPDPTPATFLPTATEDPASSALRNLEDYFDSQISGSPECLALSSNSDTVSFKQEVEEESDSGSDSATFPFSPEALRNGSPYNADEVCDPESKAPELPLQDDGDIAEPQPFHARNFASVLTQNCDRLAIPQAASSPWDVLRWSVEPGAAKKRRLDDEESKPKIKFVKKT